MTMHGSSLRRRESFAHPLMWAIPSSQTSMPREIHSAFHAFLRDPDFPCLGAKSLVNQMSYRFALFQDLGNLLVILLSRAFE